MGLRVVAKRQSKHRSYLRRSAHSRKIQPLFEELWDAGDQGATITLKPVAMVLSKAGESRDSFRVFGQFALEQRFVDHAFEAYSALDHLLLNTERTCGASFGGVGVDPHDGRRKRMTDFHAARVRAELTKRRNRAARIVAAIRDFRARDADNYAVHVTPGDEREAAAESEKKHAADLSARVANDDSDWGDGECPPRPPTRKYK
jgi:hypothetical protein